MDDPSETNALLRRMVTLMEASMEVQKRSFELQQNATQIVGKSVNSQSLFIRLYIFLIVMAVILISTGVYLKMREPQAGDTPGAPFNQGH